jgi:hypothetical protein
MEEIKKLQRDYIYYYANRQWDELLDCFAEDATVDIAYHGLRKGKKAIAELVNNIFDKLVKPTQGHFLDQPMISVEGDTAKGVWILYIFFAEPKESCTQCLFECDYVKIDGKWKFIFMELISPWPGTGPNIQNIQFSRY